MSRLGLFTSITAHHPRGGFASATALRKMAFRMAGVLALMSAGSAMAATYTVATLGGEAGGCNGTDCTTVRAAVAAANATGDTDAIVFASFLFGTVPLGDTLTISGSLTLSGATGVVGVPDITLDGGNARRVVYVTAGAQVTLSHLRLTHGYGNTGGAIYNDHGNLTVDYCTLSDNNASYPNSDGFGGAIDNWQGTLVVRHSLLANNDSDGSYGGTGGAISSAFGSLTIENSTLSDNTARNGTTGIFNNDGPLVIRSSTLWNSDIYSSGGSSPTTLSGSIFAGTDPVECENNGTGITPFHAKNSLFQHSMSCVTDDQGGNIVGDPKLSPLRDYGGPTLAHVPQTGGPAVDAYAAPCFVADDQRGVARPQSAACDIGAVETKGRQIEVSTESDVVAADGECSLREAIANADADDVIHDDCASGEHDDTIVFLQPDVRRIVLSGGVLNLLKPASITTIDGGSTGVTIDANAQSRVFRVGSGATATLTRLSIAGGFAGISGGGGIYNQGTLTLSYSTVSGSSAGSGGGIENEGSLTVRHSTLTGNQATVSHGGGINNLNTLALSHSTVAGNSAVGLGGGVHNLSGTATVSHSLLAGNAASTAASTNCYRSAGNLDSLGYNLDSGTSCGFASANGSLSNADAKLQPLHDNGGPAPTLFPGGGSAAIDAVACDADPANVNDERGHARGRDYPVIGIDGSKLCDVGAVEADQIVVTTEADDTANDGQCSLREAIANANANNHTSVDCTTGTGEELIVFAPGVQHITLSGTELLLSLSQRTLIDGGDAGVTLDGNGQSRVLEFTGGANVVLTRISLVNGNAGAGNGGGVHAYQGSLDMRYGSVSGNSAANGGGVYGSSLRLDHSVVSNNTATAAGGGVYNGLYELKLLDSTVAGNDAGTKGGGVYVGGTASIVRSTLSGNTAANDYGGGLYVGTTAKVDQSTVSGNSAKYGGAIAKVSSTAGTVFVRHSTLMNNTATTTAGGVLIASGVGGVSMNLAGSIIAGSTGVDCYRAASASVSASNSLVEDGSCSIVAGSNGNLVGDPMLGALQDNGGPTLTHKPATGSKVIDAVQCNAIAGFDNSVDQRGAARPFSAACDMGSVEAGLPDPVYYDGFEGP